ncbi:MAG: recombinase family protein [Ruminococcus sp.]|nr:recombinase family protein [Ruminococcus sp.]
MSSNGNRAALYLRLSKEDKDKLNKGDDSASIQNQRLLLTDYALEHDYEIVEVYSDDDESGLFDTRPDFERMLLDARLGKMDIILAKSQSRFSRNMEHIEKYLHHDFINLGIRFIGVVDGADTANEENKKSRQINGLVNEWYCEDLSKNIRSAFRAKMKAGQFLGSSCPYGYVKDPKDHNHLIIDDYAAAVVRRIYRLYLHGYGKAKIGKILSEEGILIPSRYKREVLGIRYQNAHELDTTKIWSYQTIHTILNNEVYIGNIVQNKYSNLSYKEKRHIRQPEENWIRVEKQHEPIIDTNIFKEVQKRQKIRTKSVNNGEKASLFSGILICADCRHAMVRTYERRGEHKFKGYCCKTYKTQGKQFCPSHSIDYGSLKEAVLEAVKREARQLLTPDDLMELNQIEAADSLKKDYASQIQLLEKEAGQQSRYKKLTYQNYMDALISKEEYLSYAKEYEDRISVLQEKIQHLNRKVEEEAKMQAESDQWITEFKNHINLEELTYDVVRGLIEQIEVNQDGSINIFYRFGKH